MEVELGSFDLRKNAPTRKYKAGDKDGKRKHLGQLKLCIALLDFLNHAIKAKGLDYKAKIYMAYVGVAPAAYMGLFLGMFPHLEIEGWDPHALSPDGRFITDPVLGLDGSPKVLSSTRFQMHRKYFLDRHVKELATEVARRRKLGYLTLFVSDIRRDIYSDTADERAKAEMDIMEDMELQKGWARGVQADFSKFKFRPPYSYIKLVNGSVRRFESIRYFPGIVRRQVYPPLLSTETRLYVKRDDLEKEIDYDNVEYEEKLFYHNTVVREHDFGKSTKFRNLRMSERFAKFTQGHEHSFDSYWTMRIIADYVRSSRKMSYNAMPAVTLEYKLLDLLLHFCMNPKKFAKLTPPKSDIPYGSPMYT